MSDTPVAPAATIPPAAPSAPAPAATPETPPVTTPAAAAVAPAEVTLKFPDGFKADEESVKWLKGIAKEAGLKPEHAQAFVDFDVKRQAAFEAKQKESFDLYVKNNAEQVKKEWGQEYDKNLALTQKPLADPRFPTAQKLMALANEVGLGTHPVLLGFLKEIGSALAEDRADRGGKAAAPVDDSRDAQARQMFPNSPEMFQARR